MRYQGGKSKISKHIASIINSIDSEVYYEPFVGGCSIMEKVNKEVRIGSDICDDLILMWKAVQQGWVPPNVVTPEQYESLKDSESSPLKGFAKYGCSWGAKAWGGYARGAGRNFADESSRNIQKQAPKLENVTFMNCQYNELEIPAKSIVYCDPPYADTTEYGAAGSFDHTEFWSWVREVSRHSYVLVSELTAPDDFVPIWEKTHTSSYVNGKTTKGQRTEKLFVMN